MIHPPSDKIIVNYLFKVKHNIFGGSRLRISWVKKLHMV